jgi:hypothetical protein
VLSDAERMRSWVEVGGDSDHLPIILQLKKENNKPPSSFKFNSKWIEDKGFINLVRS